MPEGGGGDVSGPALAGVTIDRKLETLVQMIGMAAAANANDRQVAAEWLQTNPWQYVLLISIAPLDDLLCTLELSSWEYEKQQLCEAMKDILEGTTPSRLHLRHPELAAELAEPFKTNFAGSAQSLYKLH
eukprot:722886-Amphidinium_carterae.1